MELKLFIIPRNMNNVLSKEIYLETYKTWKTVWDEVYKDEMGLQKTLFSDEFLRQDYIVSLFADAKCAGLAFVRITDFTFQPVREDSYFRNWPLETLDKVGKISGQVALASYFTVHPTFRQKRNDFCMKTLLLSLYLEHFNTLPVDIMLTAARRVRSNEKLCSRLGSRVLATNLPYLIDGKCIEQEFADLIYWERGRVPVPEELKLLHQSVWKNRIIIEGIPSTKEVRHAA